MRFSRSVLLLAANYCRAYMRNKIKLLKMCTIVRRFGLIHICSSDGRVSTSALVEQITCIFGVNHANCDTSTKVGIGYLYGH